MHGAASHFVQEIELAKAREYSSALEESRMNSFENNQFEHGGTFRGGSSTDNTSIKLNYNDQKRSVDDRLADNTNSQVSQVNRAPNDVITDLEMSAADMNPGRRNQRPSSNRDDQELGAD